MLILDATTVPRTQPLLPGFELVASTRISMTWPAVTGASVCSLAVTYWDVPNRLIVRRMASTPST